MLSKEEIEKIFDKLLVYSKKTHLVNIEEYKCFVEMQGGIKEFDYKK